MELSQVLIGPIVTEKAVNLQSMNQHVFSVHGDATKIDVMNAIRTYYGVKPDAVRILFSPRKERSVGRGKIMTKRKKTKKAIVLLPKGASIELVSTKKSSKK